MDYRISVLLNLQARVKQVVNRMLVTARVMVSWFDMTEQMFKLLFSLLPSSAFAVTVIPHCISVLLIKCYK